MLQQDTVEHGTFDQRECANCRSGDRAVERTTGRFLRNAFSAWVLMQPSMAGSNDFFGFNDLAGNHHFLRIKQVDGNGDGLTQVASYLFDHFAGQRIAFVCRFADGADLTIFQRDAALVTLLQQMANAMFNGGIGGNGFKTAKVTAVAALAKRFHLDMTNLAYVTVTANKNAAIRDDARTCTTVNAHQNRVFAVLARTKVVLRQRQASEYRDQQSRSA